MARVSLRGVRERERRREAELAQRHAEERLQIAEDLHDGIAHSLSLIAIQSRVAARQFEPGPASEALGVITTTSRAAIGQLQELLGDLRAGDAPRSPVGDLPMIATLVDQGHQAGQPVQLTIVGHERFSASVENVAYRVVQESLPNAGTHAPGQMVDVHVD